TSESTARRRGRRWRPCRSASTPTTPSRRPKPTSAKSSSASREGSRGHGGLIVGRGEAYGALVLRVFLGVIYMAHAYLALVVMGPARAMEYQRSVHIPLPEIGVWYLIIAHGLGGLLLILGILVRWAALANLPVMLGALWFVHLSQGFFIYGGKSGCKDRLFPLRDSPRQALPSAGTS